MRTRVFIVGDLPGRPDRAALVRDLKARHAAFEWDWIQPDNEQFGLPPKYFQKLVNQLRTPVADVTIVVVKLALIHGKDMNTLYGVYPDPIEPPRDLSTPEQLVNWILSPDSNLVPRNTWSLPVRQVGLLCLLTKLARKRAWNKDQHGHAWIKEADLTGQAPVSRPRYPRVYAEALNCLGLATGTLLLTKGGNQGRTPKEWSINTAYLPAVKRTILDRSLNALRAEAGLRVLMAYVDSGDPNDMVEIDDVIVSQRVLAICRDR